MSAEIHVGNTGTVFQFQVLDQDSAAVPLGGHTLQMVFSRPDTTRLVVTPTFTTDGSDGYIQYSTISGDLNQAGIWRLQAVVTSGSRVWYSNALSFKVFPNI